MDEIPEDIAHRFRTWAEGQDPEACWVWLLSLTEGYGQFGWRRGGERQQFQAHRLAWLIFVGPIPPGHHVDHECHEDAWQRGDCAGGPSCPHRACWNPAHLRLLTNSENAANTAARNRTTCRNGVHPWPEAARPNGPGKTTCGPCRRESNRASAATRRSAA